MHFVSLCETLWQDWLADRLDVSPFVRRTFDLDAVPEPYVIFGSGQKPLFQLLTNPGYTMGHQRRVAVQTGSSDPLRPLRPAIDYKTAAEALGRFYEKELAREAAGHRIARIKKLSALLGTEGVVQVDVCPFHSPSLPGKARLMHEIQTGDDLLTRYVEALREFLSAGPVVALSGASSQTSLELEPPLSPWASWLLEIIGLDPNSAEFVSLVKRGEKITVGAFVSNQNGNPRALVQMMGNNNLPGENGLATLADALRRQQRPHVA